MLPFMMGEINPPFIIFSIYGVWPSPCGVSEVGPVLRGAPAEDRRGTTGIGGDTDPDGMNKDEFLVE